METRPTNRSFPILMEISHGINHTSAGFSPAAIEFSPMEQPSTSSSAAAVPWRSPKVRLRRQRLESLLEELQRTLDGLRDVDLGVSLPEVGAEAPERGDKSEGDGGGDVSAASVAGDSDHETDQMFDLLQSKCGSPEFLQKMDEIQNSVYQNGAVEPDTSWGIIKTVDLWEDDDSDSEYVLVKPEDAADGIAFFVATYLLTLTKSKELSPDRLQKALKKTFAAEKKKGKLRKAWDGSKIIYNVASWSATAIGIYNNQAILKVATTAFRTSFRLVSKFL